MTGRIIYRSLARRGIADLMEFASILGEARHRNARMGLTGVLVGAKTHYLQSIEGPMVNLDQLYRKICTDPRHSNIELIERTTTPYRVFSGSAMAGAILGSDLEPQMMAIGSMAQPSIEQCLTLLTQAVVGEIMARPHVSDDQEFSREPFAYRQRAFGAS